MIELLPIERTLRELARVNSRMAAIERELAGRMHLRESEVHRFLEGSAGLFERWKIDQSKLSSYTAAEILQIARKGNVLIRGWGATQLLQDVPHVIRVRVCAPMALRIERMLKRMNISDVDVARREIERSDAAHTRVMQQFFDTDWRDPVNYHLVLNTGVLPVEACIDQVRLLTQNEIFVPSEASKAVIDDKIIETQIRTALDESEGAGLHGRSFDIDVSGGTVVVSGALASQGQIDAANDLIGGVDGVIEIQNELLVMPNVPLV